MKGLRIFQWCNRQQLGCIADEARLAIQHLMMSRIQSQASIKISIRPAKALPLELVVVWDWVVHHEVEPHRFKNAHGMGYCCIVQRKLAQQRSWSAGKYACA